MSSFEDRKKSFENKFARDEEVRFKIFAKRNKLLTISPLKIFDYKIRKEVTLLLKVFKLKHCDQVIICYNSQLC